MITDSSGKILVLCEGQQHWLDPNIANSDANLRDLFRLMDPIYAAATIKRVEGAAIEIIPKEGKKNSPLQQLAEAPLELNPAVVTLRELQHQTVLQNSLPTAADLAQIEATIQSGKQWINAGQQTVACLARSTPDAIGISSGL